MTTVGRYSPEDRRRTKLHDEEKEDGHQHDKNDQRPLPDPAFAFTIGWRLIAFGMSFVLLSSCPLLFTTESETVKVRLPWPSP